MIVSDFYFFLKKSAGEVVTESDFVGREIHNRWDLTRAPTSIEWRERRLQTGSMARKKAGMDKEKPPEKNRKKSKKK